MRVRPSGRHVQDGPYADTKEQLGGYIVLEGSALDRGGNASRGRCRGPGGLRKLRIVQYGLQETLWWVALLVPAEGSPVASSYQTGTLQSRLTGASRADMPRLVGVPAIVRFDKGRGGG